MSQNDARARPSQVTVAGWAVAISSVIVVLAVFQSMSDLHSLDMREELSKLVTSGAGKDLGLSVDDAIVAMRWSLFVSGVAAAATAILGVFVLQRNHGARIGLSIAAVPVVITAPFAGSLPGMVVGVGALMLWSRPARDWFAGRPITRAEPRRPGRDQAERTQAPPAPFEPPAPPPDQSAPTAQLPPPTHGWGGGTAPGTLDFPPPNQPPVITGAVQFPPPAWAARPAETARPRSVRLACLITWAVSALTGVGALISIGIVAANKDTLVDRVTSNEAWNTNMDESLIIPVTIVMAVVVALWSAAAIALAVLVWRRRTWAWAALLVSSGMAAVLSVPFFAIAFVPLGATALVIGLLLNKQSRTWFKSVPGPSRPGGPPVPQPPRPW